MTKLREVKLAKDTLLVQGLQPRGPVHTEKGLRRKADGPLDSPIRPRAGPWGGHPWVLICCLWEDRGSYQEDLGSRPRLSPSPPPPHPHSGGPPSGPWPFIPAVPEAGSCTEGAGSSQDPVFKPLTPGRGRCDQEPRQAGRPPVALAE